MRLNKVAAKAVAVMAMALMGWTSPINAISEPGCNDAFCHEILGPMGCYELEELVEICDQVCPKWTRIDCFNQDIPCDPWEKWVLCTWTG